MPVHGFDSALSFVLRWEGGRVDDPADRGGRTAYGITQRTYDGWRGSADKRDVFEITRDEVAEIYRARYWSRLVCDEYSWPLALVLFDSGVHSGPARAAAWLSAARWADAAEDRIAFALLTLRREFLLGLIKTNPAQEKFRKGWMNRLDSARLEAGL